MTREEVIKEVKNYDNYPNGISKECRDYILKALEQEPFINKSCVSSGVCEHDKNIVIDKIHDEVSHLVFRPYEGRNTLDRKDVLQIIDKYKSESEK